LRRHYFIQAGLVNRFRANLVLKGFKSPLEEMDWVEIRIGTQKFTVGFMYELLPSPFMQAILFLTAYLKFRWMDHVQDVEWYVLTKQQEKERMSL